MSTALAVQPIAEQIERVLISGDLSGLSSEQRLAYYRSVCEATGLNPLTQPFAYLRLNGKEVLYALKTATDQLRKVHSISIQITAREVIEGVYIVTARATDRTGRTDESTGAVNVENLKGESRANALMKAETKAKRRVTLSICGLGMLDETEVETIPGAQVVPMGPVALPKAPGGPASPPPSSLPAASAAPSASAAASSTATPLDGPIDVDTGEVITEEARKEIGRLCFEELHWSKSHATRWLMKAFGVGSTDRLTLYQGNDAVALLEARAADRADTGNDKGPRYEAKLAVFIEAGRVAAAAGQAG